jgi:hypothetical protein
MTCRKEAEMSRLLLSCLVAGALGGISVWAHHTVPGRSHPSVTLTQQVMADGKPLPPGTYEIWISDERPNTGAGATNAQRVVEFVQNGKVVARDVAEVFAAGERAVGTSGSTGVARARVEQLRGGEFVRIAITDVDGRYLIHLPTGALSGPAPQPQAPSRIELPPQTTPQPANPQ